MENFILDYLKNKKTLASTLQGCHVTPQLPLAKYYRHHFFRVEFLRISRAPSKMEDFSHNCKHLSSRMLKQNGQKRRFEFS